MAIYFFLLLIEASGYQSHFEEESRGHPGRSFPWVIIHLREYGKMKAPTSVIAIIVICF